MNKKIHHLDPAALDNYLPSNVVLFPTAIGLHNSYLLPAIPPPMLNPNATAMTTLNPSLNEFHLHALDTAFLSEQQAHVSFKVDLEHEHMTQRVMLSLLDDTRTQGAAISIYPATGEVCDLTNDGGVIGYLSGSPFPARTPIACEISIYRFGKNCVCQAKIAGETFLYPAFRMEGEVRLTAIVGGGKNGAGIQWDEDQLLVQDSGVAAA